METTFVALIAYAVLVLTVDLSVDVILSMQDGVEKLTPAQLEQLAMQGRWHGAALIIACPTTLAVLWIGIRRAGRQFSEYLALNWPNRNELLIAFAAMAVILLIEMSLWPAAPSTNPILTVRGVVGLLALLIGGCIAAPITEEFLFRGFLFRGWSESFLGPLGAIALSSVIWGLYHTQYDGLIRLWIGICGGVLCAIRWRTNSTWLTVIAHSATNTVVFFTAGPYI